MQGYPTMFMKTGNLIVLSDDVDENTPLNTRSVLAQRAMLSSFIGNSLFAATRVYDKRNVKNEGCSQWLIENKGPKKVLPMSL